METLETLSLKGFFMCKKAKLDISPYCLLNYIYVLMNKREIYFLCKNNEEYICLEYPENKQCKHCKRLEKFNWLFEKIRKKNELIVHETKYALKLKDLVDRCANHILKYGEYYILPELKDKICDINH